MGERLKRKILLVEDEAVIRMTGSDALMDAGYEVLEAASADEALRILDGFSDIDVLFTDIRMPGRLNGMELAELVHSRWPDIKILITSGDTFPAKSDIPDDGKFLSKPYRLEDLKREVDRLARR